MISTWHQHLTDDAEKTRFKQHVLSSKAVLDRLTEMLNDIQNNQDQIERSTKLYDLPNWDYRQAHLNGYKDCLMTIKHIINLDRQEKPID